MGGLNDIMKRREERQAAMPQGDGGIELWMRTGDVTIAHSLYSGQEGDPFFEYYLVHEYPATTQGGFATLVLCPVESGFDGNYDCAGCRDNVKTKDRFAMWLHVYSIYHKQLDAKRQENFPPAIWSVDGGQYFLREVNKPRLWKQSAWKDSPLPDIHMLANQAKDLRQFRVNIRRVNVDPAGQNFGVRYKFYAEMGTGPIDPALYAADVAEIKPVRQMLMEELAAKSQAPAPTVQKPEAMPANVTQLPPPVATAPSPPFVPQTAPPSDSSAPPALPPFKMPESKEPLF